MSDINVMIIDAQPIAVAMGTAQPIDISLGEAVNVYYGQGGNDAHYEQGFTNSTQLAVSHNLGKYPAVTVIDSAGDEVEGSVEYNDINSVTVAFSAPFSGKVICN